MNLRVLIFDDDPMIRDVLWKIFDRRGYEVFTFPHPATCPLSGEKHCPCPGWETCADIIISDLNMPVKTGIDFLEEQINKGCKCRVFALMSGDLTTADLAWAASLGITVFKKPFTPSEINTWLDQLEKGFDPQRKLADWFLEKR